MSNIKGALLDAVVSVACVKTQGGPLLYKVGPMQWLLSVCWHVDQCAMLLPVCYEAYNGLSAASVCHIKGQCRM